MEWYSECLMLLSVCISGYFLPVEVQMKYHLNHIHSVCVGGCRIKWSLWVLWIWLISIPASCCETVLGKSYAIWHKLIVVRSLVETGFALTKGKLQRGNCSESEQPLQLAVWLHCLQSALRQCLGLLVPAILSGSYWHFTKATHLCQAFDQFPAVISSMEEIGGITLITDLGLLV